MHDAIPSRILNGWLRLEEDLFHLQVLSSLPPQIPICCSIFVFKLYHKTCEQFYRHFGLYEKSPNSFLPGLPRSIINQFDFHNFLCLCLASVHLPYPFHLVSAFSFSVTPFRFANSGTISSMRFRAASSILAQYCLTYTQLWAASLFFGPQIYGSEEAAAIMRCGGCFSAGAPAAGAPDRRRLPARSPTASGVLRPRWGRRAASR